MAVNITVRLVGIFRVLSGKNRLVVRFDAPVTVWNVVEKLVELFSPGFAEALVDPVLGEPWPNALILVNGREVGVLGGVETEVEDGAEIVLVPVAHGG